VIPLTQSFLAECERLEVIINDDHLNARTFLGAGLRNRSLTMVLAATSVNQNHEHPASSQTAGVRAAKAPGDPEFLGQWLFIFFNIFDIDVPF
jgi:hypothetical protein